MRIMIGLAALTMAFGGSTPALAQGRTIEGRAAMFDQLVRCRALPDSAQRLACFDREVAALEAAEARKDIVVVDRDQIRQTRRTLFGLSLPSLAILGGDRDEGPEEEGITSIETTVTRAERNGLGKWVITLAEGARWIQTDEEELVRWPEPGDKIRIRRAALGSYIANVNGGRGIRVRRIQ